MRPPERDRRLLHAIFIDDADKDEVCREFKVDRNYLRGAAPGQGASSARAWNVADRALMALLFN